MTSAVQMSPVQTSLFDLGSTDEGLGLGPLGGMITRQVLGRGAWVDLLPGWLSGSEALFDDLLSQVPLAGRAAADVRPGGRSAAAAQLLRRG